MWLFQSTVLSFFSMSVNGDDILAKPLMKRRYTFADPRKAFIWVGVCGNFESRTALVAFESEYTLNVPGRMR